MSTGHTPGPWVIGGELISAAGTEIASVWSRTTVRRAPPPLSEADANARLIAAAPELLAACRQISAAMVDLRAGRRDGGTMGRLSMADDLIRAAIAKAEGK